MPVVGGDTSAEGERNDRSGIIALNSHSLSISINTLVTHPKSDPNPDTLSLLLTFPRRCGLPKTNHVCEYYEDTSMSSTGTQVSERPVTRVFNSHYY